MKLENTAAIVTGGASGLGAATAAALAEQGASVYALDLASSIEQAPEVKGVAYAEVDVTDAEQVKVVVAKASSGTIAPGIIMTPMLMTVSDGFRAGLAAGVPFPKRLGDPSEYAKLALSIIDNDYLNGEVIRLDGSLRMAAR